LPPAAFPMPVDYATLKATTSRCVRADKVQRVQSVMHFRTHREFEPSRQLKRRRVAFAETSGSGTWGRVAMREAFHALLNKSGSAGLTSC
jgi:hypothetical protein